ncbi:GNAT family N-acetyltransferase [Pseudoalteromonas xiamenensis]
MKKVTLEHHSDEVASFLSQQLIAFNRAHWDVTVKEAISATLRDEQEQIIAGLSGMTFGNWLHIERLWVSDRLRGQGIGSELLQVVENEAIARGCRFALLDTLEFQAKPFYERHGYHVEWVQTQYPLNGQKYFMTKTLVP